MSKFIVGEIAIVACADFDPPCFQPAWTIGEHVEIIRVEPFSFLNEADYLVQFGNGMIFPWDENTLRKLPPDSTEDPGLTRIKKLLLQDTKHKEREHESS